MSNKKHRKSTKNTAELDKYGHDPITFGINWTKAHPLHHDPHCELWCFLQLPHSAEIQSTYMMTETQKGAMTSVAFGHSESVSEVS